MVSCSMFVISGRWSDRPPGLLPTRQGRGLWPRPGRTGLSAPVFGSVLEAHGGASGEADLKVTHDIGVARQRRGGFLRLRRAGSETSKVGSVLRHDLFLMAFQSSMISSAAFDLGSVSTTPRPVEAAC